MQCAPKTSVSTLFPSLTSAFFCAYPHLGALNLPLVTVALPPPPFALKVMQDVGEVHLGCSACRVGLAIGSSRRATVPAHLLLHAHLLLLSSLLLLLLLLLHAAHLAVMQRSAERRRVTTPGPCIEGRRVSRCIVATLVERLAHHVDRV